MSADVVQLPKPLGLEVVNMRRMNKGALIAFVDVKILAWGITLIDCKWFRKDEREWIGLPSTNYTTKQGKTIYKNLVEFSTPEALQRFQTAVLTELWEVRPKS